MGYLLFIFVALLIVIALVYAALESRTRNNGG